MTPAEWWRIEKPRMDAQRVGMLKALSDTWEAGREARLIADTTRPPMDEWARRTAVMRAWSEWARD